MRPMIQIKKIFSFIFIVVFIVVCCVLFFSGDSADHIEDTNGADVYTLQTITDENIEKLNIGSKGFGTTTNKITNRTYYSSNKFTGVTEVFETNVISDSYTIYITEFEVNEGNVKLVLVQDNRIVHEFVPNEADQEYTLDNAAGSHVSLRIAGESADFKLEIL